MDELFASARKQYRDNFLQYSLTSDSKYKQAYQESKKRMDNILDSLQHQVDSSKAFTSGDIVHKLREAKARQDAVYGNFMNAKDALTEAKMRGTEPQTIPNMRWQYITLGTLSGFGILLALL